MSTKYSSDREAWAAFVAIVVLTFSAMILALILTVAGCGSITPSIVLADGTKVAISCGSGLAQTGMAIDVAATTHAGAAGWIGAVADAINSALCLDQAIEPLIAARPGASHVAQVASALVAHVADGHADAGERIRVAQATQLLGAMSALRARK